MDIDIYQLVDDGYLDLQAIFHKESMWTRYQHIADYTLCCYGPNGDEPGLQEVWLQRAEAYGIVAYRWRVDDGEQETDRGYPTLDEDQAIEDGREYAESSDEALDTDELLDQIVATGYFGDADADDIRAICEEATQHSQGYLLLPKGEPVGHPVGRMWTINGYLSCDHLQLPATHSDISYAAASLLRQVTAATEDDSDN